MSFDNDIDFTINFNGKFETINGQLMYVGGSTHHLEAPSQALFRGLEDAGLDLYGQRVWYKLPYEGLKDLKVLCDGAVGFEYMCRAAAYTKVVEIFIEHESAHSEFENGSSDNNIGGNDEEFHEEERVEDIVARFVDEEEDNSDYRNTPPTSDCEEEAKDNQYETYRKGSGELKIMQVFDSIKSFKEAVLEYALKGAWNIKYSRWGSVKGEAKCAIKGQKRCGWRIYCSFEESANRWMVKTFQDEHSCSPYGLCRLLTESVVANMFLDAIRKNPDLMPTAIQGQIQERYSLTVKPDTCRKARKRALDMIKDEYDQQFSRMKDYKDAILTSNPGSTVDLVTTPVDGGEEMFDRFYVCFYALRKTWKSYCRPIFGIDGCFLKSTTKGQLLAAVGRDANNQIYPIVWAVVKVEDTDSWLWFIKKLKIDLDLGDGNGYTLISDKQKGLVKAVHEELPKVEHRMCARHLYGNVKKGHPKNPQVKKLFWKVVDSFNEADHIAALSELEKLDPTFHAALITRDLKVSCRAYFKTTSCCEDALNNFSESYNSAIEKARSLPLVEMLETMRRQTMIRIDLRKRKTMKYKSLHSLKVKKVFAIEEKQKKWCTRIPGSNASQEVVENGTAHSVDIDMKTCSCRKWDITGIPCRHALKVMTDMNLDRENYVSDWYLSTTWQNQYSDSIRPVEGLKFWKKSDEATLLPPPRETSKGRKKKPAKRIKSIHESPTKGKKVSNHKRIIHCGRCHLPGHNATRCENTELPYQPKPKKTRKKIHIVEESISLDHGEASSQPTQTSSYH